MQQAMLPHPLHLSTNALASLLLPYHRATLVLAAEHQSLREALGALTASQLKVGWPVLCVCMLCCHAMGAAADAAAAAACLLVSPCEQVSGPPCPAIRFDNPPLRPTNMPYR